MLDLLQNTLDGLLAGAGYALLALGFTLIFGVLRRMNLSYGAAIMFGCYCATWVALKSPIAAPIGLVVLAVIGLAGTTLGGAYVERLCFAPHARSGSGAIAAMVGSFALWMQFEEAVTLVLPRHLYSFPPLYSGAPIALGPLSLRVEALITLAVGLVVCAGLWWCLYRTRFGTAARAFTQDPTAAQLSGIGPGRVMAGVFAIASIIGGTAGFLVVSTHEQVTPMLGMWATVKGLVAMMLGGLGSLPGAVIGGLVLGLVEAHAQWYLGPQLREMTVYLLLFVLLALQPAWMTRFTVEPARGD